MPYASSYSPNNTKRDSRGQPKQEGNESRVTRHQHNRLTKEPPAGFRSIRFASAVGSFLWGKNGLHSKQMRLFRNLLQAYLFALLRRANKVLLWEQIPEEPQMWTGEKR